MRSQIGDYWIRVSRKAYRKRGRKKCLKKRV